MTFKKKSAGSTFGAQQVGDGTKVIKKAQKNIAKVLGGTSPATVGLEPKDEDDADEKLMKKVKTYCPPGMKKAY